MGLSTTYTKTETDFLIQQLEKKTASGYKGDLRIADAAPTSVGFYGLLETGVYTKLGGINAQSGKLNFASFDGTTWSLIAVEIPINYNTGGISPTSTNNAETGKSVSNFVTNNIFGATSSPLNINVENGKYAYLIKGNETVDYLRMKEIAISTHAAFSLITISRRFNDNDFLQINFGRLYTETSGENVVYFLSDDRILKLHLLNSSEVLTKSAVIRIPKGTNKIFLSSLVEDSGLVSANLLSSESFIPHDYYYGQNIPTSWTSGKRLNDNGIEVASSVGCYVSDYIPIYGNVLTTYGVNPHPSSSFVFYDENKNILKVILRENSLIVHNPITEGSVYWDLLTDIKVPEGAKYVRLTHNKAYYSKVESTKTYFNDTDRIFVYFKNDYDVIPEKRENIVSNIVSQKNIPLEVGSKNTNGNKILIFKNKSNNKCGRVAFRFKLLEDVNNENSEKKLVEFVSSDGTKYFNFVLNKALTSQIIDKDHLSATSNTTYPIPMFNSGVGVRTNLLSVDASRRTLNYAKRGIKRISDTSIGKNSKPLCGEPLFYVRFISGDVSDTAKQALMTTWSDLTFTINASSLILSSANNGFSVTSNFIEHDDMVTLFNDFKNKIKSSILGNSVEVVALNLNSFKSTFTTDSRYDNFRISNKSNDFVAMSVPLISDYWNVKNNKMVKDSFPAYAFKGVDESWHTFEFVLPLNSNMACFTIDGQVFEYDGNFAFSGVKDVFDKGGLIKIGTEVLIDVKDLVIEFDEYSDAEVRDFQPYSHRLVSSYHPYIVHAYGHDIYYCEDKGEPYENFGKYHLYVSEGGYIPDELKHSDPDYEGDDSIQPHRRNLAHPSFLLENYLGWIKEAGYVPVTNRDLAEFHRTGKPLPKRGFLIGFDDMPTYIFERQELRSIFTKYGFRPYFAIELGYYVDSSIVSDYDITGTINANKDTDSHRLKLQKRVQLMQTLGWDIVIHGKRRGFEHRGSSYEEMKNEFSEAQNIAIQMGFGCSYWCIAANLWTPNSIYLHNISGIETSSSTEMVGSALFQHPNFIGRTGWESTISMPNFRNKSRIL